MQYRGIQDGGDFMLEQFVTYLMRLGKQPNTITTYYRDAVSYLMWCQDTFGEQPTQLYRANVLEYISYMRTIKQYSPKTLNRHLSSLRSYNDWLIESLLYFTSRDAPSLGGGIGSGTQLRG